MVKKVVKKKSSKNVRARSSKEAMKTTQKKSFKKVESVKEKRNDGEIIKREDLNQIAYIVPRIIGILITVLIASFSLGVFQDYSGKAQLFALFLYLIPAIIVAIFLIISWKYEVIGGSLFVALGVILGIFFGGFQAGLNGFVVLVLPIWLLGALFWLSHKLNSSK